MGLFDRSLFSAVSAKFLGIYRLASPDPTDSESSRLQVDIFRFCFHPFEVYPMDSSKMIGNPPEVSNFNRSFSNSTGFICNYPPVLSVKNFHWMFCKDLYARGSTLKECNHYSIAQCCGPYITGIWFLLWPCTTVTQSEAQLVVHTGRERGHPWAPRFARTNKKNTWNNLDSKGKKGNCICRCSQAWTWLGQHCKGLQILNSYHHSAACIKRLWSQEECAAMALIWAALNPKGFCLFQGSGAH